ncbi:CPBP family intramembrane glutamic endopeptidase [Peptostreptococcus equinus]|uniref:Type II CAAX endopeptidase family protein n=1 Tax=Peptostreptococcus equinus TaxID=3003601 RepID=A0ABY7JR05_9FIRM|nr:type II CAAX endopeptidase family protein [Peptostreptococcus sp. CBA3647]WAW14400.1 type II CAAX endopeptidase family protein [Peptostreptococcus sp. CBA3647]
MKHIKEILRNNLLWIWFLGFFLLIGGEIISDICGPIKLPFFDKDFNEIFNAYINFWGIWFFTIIYLIIFKRKNLSVLNSLKYNTSGNNIKNLFFGFLLGLILNVLCILVAYLNGDFQLYFFKFQPIQLFILFEAVFVQSSAEELICRGFLYQRIKSRYNSKILAIISNSLFFAAIHLGNDGISPIGFLDLFLTGILFSLFVYYFDSLWMAMACHTTWNFSQNIIFGLPNSGLLSQYSIFMMNKNSLKNSFAFDKIFGVEGTIMSVTIISLSCIFIYFYFKKFKSNEL